MPNLDLENYVLESILVTEQAGRIDGSSLDDTRTALKLEAYLIQDPLPISASREQQTLTLDAPISQP